MKNKSLKISVVCFGMAAAMLTGNGKYQVGTGNFETAGTAGMSVVALAEEAAEASSEEDGLLIEDFGEEIADNSGADLEKLKEAERREAEEAAAAEAAARELAEAIAAAEFRLPTADPERLQQHLDKLTEVDSPIGSDGELICAAYIEEVMEQYGFTISEQNFHEGFINENGVDAPGLNIIAERGADAEPEKRTSDIFIVAAHYDSKTNPAEDDPFANDKTGAAVLLEMARILSEIETDSDICFVFFSGEEDGLYGSMNFVDFMQEDYAHRVAGVLYVELVGYDSEDAYLLKTWDGEENDIGNLVKASELAAAMVEPEDENEEKTAGENWIWVEDAQTTQYSFVQGGMIAVTVSQDVFGEYTNEELDDLLTDEMEEILEDTGEVVEANEAEDAETAGAEGEPEKGKAKESAEDEMTDTQIIRTAAVDLDKLADITDILAASVAEIMG